jgi:hypothetical protein
MFGRAGLGGKGNDTKKISFLCKTTTTTKNIFDRIEHLHSRLKEDSSVRGQLDCYLLALYHNERAPLEWMVLDHSDTFHYYNLPDLMFLIRSTLMGLCPSLWIQKLFNMFLCGKRYRRLVHTNDNACQLTSALVNTLHGLLLGLYPFNERRMDLRKRAWLAGAVHQVLTAEGGAAFHVDFINEHQHLMCLSLMEYIVNAVEDFCPVEWALLGVTASAKSQCLASIEAFREATVSTAAAAAMMIIIAKKEEGEGGSSSNNNNNNIDIGSFFWTRLDREAQPVVSSLIKFFRGASFYQHRPRSVLALAHVKHLPLAMGTRIIQNSSSIFGQLRAALPDIHFKEAEALEEIWTALYIRRLPAHTTMQQIDALERIGGMCSFLERELFDFPLCLLCALTRRADVLRGLFRHDCIDGGLVCNECLNPVHVVRVNLLGRVLYVRDRAIVLCEKCLRPKCWDTPCSSCGAEDAEAVSGCCVCHNANVFSSKEVIDTQAMRMHTACFCYKHSLSCVISDATVYDLRTLEREVQNRYKPVVVSSADDDG